MFSSREGWEQCGNIFTPDGQDIIKSYLASIARTQGKQLAGQLPVPIPGNAGVVYGSTEATIRMLTLKKPINPVFSLFSLNRA
jgi:hypothetical protein